MDSKSVLIFSLALMAFKFLAILSFFTKQKLQNIFGTHAATWGQSYQTFYSPTLQIFVLSLSDCPWHTFPA
jgi:hypothetical protein